MTRVARLLIHESQNLLFRLRASYKITTMHAACVASLRLPQWRPGGRVREMRQRCELRSRAALTLTCVAASTRAIDDSVVLANSASAFVYLLERLAAGAASSSSSAAAAATLRRSAKSSRAVSACTWPLSASKLPLSVCIRPTSAAVCAPEAAAKCASMPLRATRAPQPGTAHVTISNAHVARWNSISPRRALALQPVLGQGMGTPPQDAPCGAMASAPSSTSWQSTQNLSRWVHATACVAATPRAVTSQQPLHLHGTCSAVHVLWCAARSLTGPVQAHSGTA